MTLSYALGTIMLTFLVRTAVAQDVLPALQTNGCDSGFSSKFVPDSMGECKFEAACHKHDLCYGKCLEGGTLFMKAECEDGNKERGSRRLQCDDQLKENITSGNEGNCEGWASFYRRIVRMVGGGVFDGMEPSTIREIIKSSGTPDVALIRLNLIKDLTQDNLVDVRSLKIMPDGDIKMDTIELTQERPGFKNKEFVIPKDFKPSASELRGSGAVRGGQ